MKRTPAMLVLLLGCLTLFAQDKPTINEQKSESPASPSGQKQQAPWLRVESVRERLYKAARESAKPDPGISLPDMAEDCELVSHRIKYGDIEVLSDTKKFDVCPYLRQVRARIQQNWYALIPEAARPPNNKTGKVTIEFSILKNGTIARMTLVEKSSDDSLDRAAWNGIANSSPFPALSEEFAGQRLALRFHFFYNPDKADLDQAVSTPKKSSGLPSSTINRSEDKMASAPLMCVADTTVVGPMVCAQDKPLSGDRKVASTEIAAAQGQAIDVLSDTQGVDFGPYLQVVLKTVKQNWFAVVPESARPPFLKRSKVDIEFSIFKDGTIAGMTFAGKSGDDSLDRAAWVGIASSNPLPPLPTEFSGQYLTLRFHFLYNPDKAALTISPTLPFHFFYNPLEGL